MSDPISTSGIYGSVDGQTPIYNPTARFTVWALTEIYQGTIGENRYVPKIGDLVKDMDLGLEFKVTAIDPSTLLVTLQGINTIQNGEFTEEDLLLGVGPGTQSDTYRVYLDNSVIPHALAVDARLSVAGTMASYCRIFRGADLTSGGDVISGFYDTQGNLLSDVIPLEVVYMPAGENVSIKTVPVCYTMDIIPDGEVVTAVMYSDAGHVISKRQLLVENTSFIRAASSPARYITGISLECPFLSTSDTRLINLPINVLLTGINMLGVVHYSDGAIVKMPVDGTKFAILGMDGYVATVVNQQANIVLRYRLSSDEVVYGHGVGEFPHISESYKIKTAQADGSYSVKLYCYPIWLDSVNGYTLRWYMYNADRTVVYNVTGLVEISSTGPAFNPILYGVNQRLSVAINLQEVNGSYRDYRHIQTVEVVLWRVGSDHSDTNWSIAFDVGQNPPYCTAPHYAALEFVNSNLYRINFASGAADITEWLDRMYYRTKPLIDQQRELQAPAPTHFRVRFGVYDLDYPISEWNVTKQIGNGITDNSTVFIEFIKRTSLSDIQLSVAGLPVWQVVSVP
jgi:hypothetical protein